MRQGASRRRSSPHLEGSICTCKSGSPHRAGPAKQSGWTKTGGLEACAIIRPDAAPPVPRTTQNARDADLISIIQAAGWPIWPLILCSVAALALVVERFISLQRKKVVPKKLLDDAMTLSLRTMPSPEVIAKLEQNSILGQILASGLRALKANSRCSDDELHAHMEAVGRQTAHQLERYLSALATIASAAPLLGLLGTVIGMIEIFGSQNPAGTGSGVGNPAQLAHGISVALYNTAFGLMVAIPTLIFWRYFRARVDAYLLTLEVASERFARHLSRLARSGLVDAAAGISGAGIAASPPMASAKRPVPRDGSAA